MTRGGWRERLDFSYYPCTISFFSLFPSFERYFEKETINTCLLRVASIRSLPMLSSAEAGDGRSPAVPGPRGLFYSVNVAEEAKERRNDPEWFANRLKNKDVAEKKMREETHEAMKVYEAMEAQERPQIEDDGVIFVTEEAMLSAAHFDDLIARARAGEPATEDRPLRPR